MSKDGSINYAELYHRLGAREFYRLGYEKPINDPYSETEKRDYENWVKHFNEQYPNNTTYRR